MYLHFNCKWVKGILILCCVFNVSFMTQKVYGQMIKEHNKIILIDPGHGGVDGGAVSKSGTIEKHITLNIAMYLKDKLEKEGFKVLMTRDSDKGLYEDSGSIRKKKLEDLDNRCKLKGECGCDMFISIHLNMFEVSKYYGAQVWYSEQNESNRLAQIVQKNLIQDLANGNHRKAKPALHYYKLLRCNDNMPSIIVECGFLSNPNEEMMLKKKSYQEKIAESLCKSIKEFYY